MPILNWIGKDKVINHHLSVDFKILNKKYTFNTNKNDLHTEQNSENKIINGDNLEALKALLPQYEGKIKCIYIDPPYNTGNENWIYNDNVNDPKIKKWLGQVVGKESEDLTRHDKWLCMMYPRLKLLHKLLKDDGVIFISIDDNEQANLKLICDEIFGSGNFIANLATIMNLKGNQDQFGFAGTHEYTFVYAKQKSKLILGSLLLEEEAAESWEKDDIGFFKKGANLKSTGANAPRQKRPNLFYPIYINTEFEVNDTRQNESDFELLPITDGQEMSWRWSKDKLFTEKFNLILSKSDNSFSIYKKQRPELGDLPSKKPKSIFYRPEYSSGNGTNQMKQIFGNKLFQTPKPLELIQDFLQISTDSNSIILDSFAGSGTTAHAVLNLNKADGGKRKFILIEMEDYAESITAERVRRVMQGYGSVSAGNAGTGGSFDFYELGEVLFDEDGFLNEKVSLDKIRAYIWFSETNKELVEKEHNDAIKDDVSFLGKDNDTSYYFHYIVGETTTLDYDFLAKIRTKAEQYIIYADNCLLTSEFLRDKNIFFKKIPREIRKF